MKNGLIIDKDGTKIYYLNDKIHREDGPALEYTDGSKEWHINGILHREDGPAIEWYYDNDPIVGHIASLKEWYYNGQFITNKSQEEFEQYIKYMIFR